METTTDLSGKEHTEENLNEKSHTEALENSLECQGSS